MNDQLAEFVRALSTLLGWLYVLSWSLSFYPQPLLNWKRKSTAGLSLDFPTLNVVGFISYTISTSCFLYSPRIREQYARRHPLAPEPTVRFNDFAFAVHALFLVALTYSQFFKRLWGIHVPPNQHTNIVTRCIVIGSLVSIPLAVAKAVSNGAHDQKDPAGWTWVDVIYIFGYIKLVATFVKYAPQALLNYRSKSTKGWSIDQVLFDFAGGVLSLAQLLIDSSFQGDWSGVTGNPAKLGLSLVSLGFDVIFITQHYLLYSASPNTNDKSSQGDARQPLLSNEDVPAASNQANSA